MGRSSTLVCQALCTQRTRVQFQTRAMLFSLKFELQRSFGRIMDGYCHVLEATITAQSVQPQGEIPEEGREKKIKVLFCHLMQI